MLQYYDSLRKDWIAYTVIMFRMKPYVNLFWSLLIYVGRDIRHMYVYVTLSYNG